jgi:hypothetical protein
VRRGPGEVWEWASSKPLRRLAVAAAPGLALSEGKVVTTPLLVASRDPDRAAALARVLSDPLAWFSGALAPYGFDELNVVFLDGLEGRSWAGGMAVVPAGTPLEGPSEGADLLAGHWFGERLAGDGRWIEAFAAWEAVTYCRDRSLPLPSEIARLREAFFALDHGDLPLALADRKAPDEIVRGKGSAVPEMVRLVVGDRAFFQAITDLFENPGPQPMSLERLREVFEKRAGRTLDRTFSDWFDRPGAPQFDTELRVRPASGGGWRADLTLRQRRGAYALPLEVVFHGPGQSHRETVDVSAETTAVFYVLPFEPARVEVDPLGKLYRFK